MPDVLGGLEGKCLYPTKKSPHVQRIVDIGRFYHLDQTAVTDNIIWAPIESTSRMHQVVKLMQKYLVQSRFGLVVIDDLIGLFRSSAEYQGRENLPMRQNEVGQILASVHDVAHVFGVLVVVTNQVSATVDGNPFTPAIAVGGNVMAHSVDTRIWMNKLDSSGKCK